MTEDELYQFRESLLATLPGFIQPIAYGVGAVGRNGTLFPVTNSDGVHRLPAIVLGSVLGYRSGTCTLAISTRQLDAAIEQLSPAEACEAFEHPNLWSWRELRATDSLAPLVAVFIGDRNDRSADEHQVTFRTLAGW